MTHTSLADAPLGKVSAYVDTYQPTLLFPIARADKRQALGIHPQQLPFQGHDIWTGYEMSWLNQKGKPQVMIAQFIIPCQSPYLIESKSFKLYLNSFNNSRFAHPEDVKTLMKDDLSNACGAEIELNFFTEQDLSKQPISAFAGHCLDELDIECQHYQVTPELLVADAHQHVQETLFSNLLKSNCLVTGQPDWGSIQIVYTGPKINHEQLLRYLVSYRNHNEFHEQCIERIFNDIYHRCKPTSLTVYARYTRRGGLDINPFRSTDKASPTQLIRHFRQ